MRMIKGVFFILVASVILYSTTSYAQSTLRERIRARRLEKKQAAGEAKVQALYDKYEDECIAGGWSKIAVNVNDLQGWILWKAPKGNWKNGAIIVLHGGGGTYSNYCANIKIGKPMIEFSNLAIEEGFAVFSLDSEEGFLKDEEGYSCGKRWLSMKENNKSNPDLDFIEKAIIETIPALRPRAGSKDIFITGISNGGFMTVLAATTFDDKITAFAPVSAGDPYGIYVNCSEGSAFRATPGKLYDSETNKTINEIGACKADGYPNEKEWNTSYPVKKPPFKLFLHQGDGVCDKSCKEKVRSLLIAHGYKDEGSFMIEDTGMRSPLKHFWVSEYNQPLIEFFKKYSGRIQNSSQSNLGPGDHEFSIEHGGLKRRYLVHAPPAYKVGNPIPVVLAFHGGGGDAVGAVSFFKLNDKSDKEGFIVVYPEGTGKRTLGKLYGAWNAGDCCGDVDDLGFISALLDKLSNDFSVDEKRVYATGHSNGALMCYRLACELSERIAAIAPAGGHDGFKNCNPKRPVSLIHFHGTEDNCARYNGGTCGGCFAEYLNSLGIPADPTKSYWKCSSVTDYIDEWRAINDCRGEGKVIYQKGNAECISYQGENNTEVVLCTIQGMGHVWPGGDYGKACNHPNRLTCKMLKKILGSLSDDLSANDMIWDFFKKHPMR